MYPPIRRNYEEFAPIEWSKVKAAPLGQTFDTKALRESCTAVRGAVSWPGKNPGFVVIIAMNRFKHFSIERREIVLLDEIETRDMWDLVRKCAALNLKYEPATWFGDPDNATAQRFIREMGRERQTTFSLIPTPIVQIDRPFQYMLQSLRRMLKLEDRVLFLKDSKILDYLGQIVEDEETELELGAFPSIEALAFAALEEHWESSITLEQIHALQRKCGLRD